MSEEAEQKEQDVSEEKDTKLVENVEKAKPKDLNAKLILGGGIELIGFMAVDLSSMVIVKKMVGSYARKFSDEHEDFEKIVLTAKKEGKQIIAELTIGGKTKKADVEESNVFVALDKVLKSF